MEFLINKVLKMANISYMLSKGWTLYPLSRPLQGQKVEVCLLDIDNTIVNLGYGLSVYSPSCGICILINGVLINSNRKVLYKIIQ